MDELLDDGDRESNMVAARVCRCDPPPTLPTGDELTALIDRARRKLATVFRWRGGDRFGVARLSSRRGWAAVVSGAGRSHTAIRGLHDAADWSPVNAAVRPSFARWRARADRNANFW